MAAHGQAKMESSVAMMTDGMRAAEITMTIKESERKWRERLPFLYYQSAIGLGLLMACYSTVICASRSYLNGGMHWVTLVAINAFSLSLVRELEHDLIHELYFPKHKLVQNAMMLAVWPMLGNLPHPWYRRDLHMLHHRKSGRREDMEERMIGMGSPMGWKRLLATLDAPIALQFRRDDIETIPFYNKEELRRAATPITKIWYLCAMTYFLLKLVLLPQACMGWTDPASPMEHAAANMLMMYEELTKVFTIWILPGWWHTVSRQIISSTMHYYEDFGGKLHECQVINAWPFAIFNMFSVNFGNSHIVHHFLEKQTFYIRELCRSDAHVAFRKHGVRFNDLGVVFRKNHFKKE
jgi:Fatty acid desaturase